MHTRGRRKVLGLKRNSSGTIHAHAGQTRCAIGLSPCSRNHPCTRGADTGALIGFHLRWEPSMHTRGRLCHRMLLYIRLGTIHAHAGQTLGR